MANVAGRVEPLHVESCEVCGRVAYRVMSTQRYYALAFVFVDGFALTVCGGCCDELGGHRTIGVVPEME